MFVLYLIKCVLFTIFYLLSRAVFIALLPFMFLYDFLKKREKEYDEKILTELGYYRDNSQGLHKIVNNVITTISKDEEERIVRQIHGKSKYTRKEQIKSLESLEKKVL